MTKAKADTARRAVETKLTHMSRYRMRRLLVLAGEGEEAIQTADEEGPSALIELILDAYDAGRLQMEMLQGYTSPSVEKEKEKEEAMTQTQQTPKRRGRPPKKKEEPQIDSDPYSNLFGDEEGGNGASTNPFDDEAPAEESIGKAPVSRANGDIEQKLDTLISLADSISQLVEAIHTTVITTRSEVVDLSETVKLSFARAFQVGLANPIKNFGAIIKMAKERAEKHISE